MKKRTYAQEITKEYLIRLGIDYVSEDGLHIFKKGKELKQCKSKSGKKHYLAVGLYDSQRRLEVPKEKRKSSTGQFTLGVHIINYVWNIGDKLEGYVIDHIDNNPLNNNISNLQLVTPKINLYKEKKNWGINQTKCKLNKPLSFYEDKLNKYLALHDEAKAAGDKEKCHKLRGNISQTRSRIRYYLAHKEEAEKIEMERLEEQARIEAYHARADKIRELDSIVADKRYKYWSAMYEYGEDHFVTNCLKAEWHEAVKERDDYIKFSE